MLRGEGGEAGISRVGIEGPGEKEPRAKPMVPGPERQADVAGGNQLQPRGKRPGHRVQSG